MKGGADSGSLSIPGYEGAVPSGSSSPPFSMWFDNVRPVQEEYWNAMSYNRAAMHEEE